eukprot:GHVL01034649.1.p1 GENE.GHVL01034649.1~~GHVL01034649.1.p1  ORF type:complete len:429 (-),score=100.15 GHVL01034649.1:249-1535(-)
MLYCIQEGIFKVDPLMVKKIAADTIISLAIDQAGGVRSRIGTLKRLKKTRKSLLEAITVLQADVEKIFSQSTSVWSRLVAFQTIRHILSNTVQLENTQGKYPALSKQVIKKPIFIIGLPRSGATLLHRLLALDDNLKCPSFAEMSTPFGHGGASASPVSINPDEKHLAAEFLLMCQLGFSPVCQVFHAQAADAPETDSVMMEHSFRSLSFCSLLNLPNYQEWLLNDDCKHLKEGYIVHKKMSQLIQWQSGEERRLVYTMPYHMLTLDELFKTYPDADIIYIHRPIEEVLQSWTKTVVTLRSVLNTQSQVNFEGAVQAEMPNQRMLIELMQQSAEKFLIKNPDLSDRFTHVKYENLHQYPIETCQEIYKKQKIPLSIDTRDLMSAWLSQEKARQEDRIENGLPEKTEGASILSKTLSASLRSMPTTKTA